MILDLDLIQFYLNINFMGVINIMWCSSVTLTWTLSKHASLASRSLFYHDVTSV